MHDAGFLYDFIFFFDTATFVPVPVQAIFDLIENNHAEVWFQQSSFATLLESLLLLINAATQDREHGKNLNPHPVIPFLLKK